MVEWLWPVLFFAAYIGADALGAAAFPCPNLNGSTPAVSSLDRMWQRIRGTVQQLQTQQV